MTEKEIISKHMAELGKKAQAKRTLEQRKAIAKKGWETRRARSGDNKTTL